MESRDLSSECEAPPHSMREAAAARGHRGATQGMITILFCGHEFPSAAAATKEVLKDQPGIEVIEVERSAVAEHIQQATVVVSTNQLSESLRRAAQLLPNCLPLPVTALASPIPPVVALSTGPGHPNICATHRSSLLGSCYPHSDEGRCSNLDAVGPATTSVLAIQKHLCPPSVPHRLLPVRLPAWGHVIHHCSTPDTKCRVPQVPKMCNIDRSMITSAKRLQLINQFGVGLEGVDIDACDEFGVHVTNIPSDGTGNAASVAEHGIYLMIGILRHHHQMQESIKAKVLGAPMGRTLQGCTVLLVGFGGIAQELAPRLKVFGVKLLAVRKGPWGLQPEVEAAVDVKGGLEDMLELAGQADIVVMLCNQTKETVGMVNNEFIGAMKPGGMLVNLARGHLLDKAAVLSGLQSGHLGGLAADVQWVEPFDPSDPIAQFPNVILTPHVAGVTEMSVNAMAKTLGENVLSIARGQVPLTRRNSVKLGLRYSMSGILSPQASDRSSNACGGV
eukprot:CAMPEP_0117659956 /NCGR_PEP_ID=MMETSP0804-20121206/6706_1 /TAXON_ID=1074897 /ORGANISM="Tetraselmis astigmatica, Strain CCMP880" /LENGTH=504 /DNA_ID=CAMNT_0005466643 /DNA_START=305 /DNA_END=1820 /DNA_ORIENTATION=+